MAHLASQLLSHAHETTLHSDRVSLQLHAVEIDHWVDVGAVIHALNLEAKEL